MPSSYEGNLRSRSSRTPSRAEQIDQHGNLERAAGQERGNGMGSGIVMTLGADFAPDTGRADSSVCGAPWLTSAPPTSYPHWRRLSARVKLPALALSFGQGLPHWRRLSAKG